jgi:heptosyltransferase-1
MAELRLPTDSFSMEVVVAPADHDSARAKLEARGGVRPFAVLCPFTTRAHKHWVEERWAALAACIEDTLGLDAVVLGGTDAVGRSRRLQEIGHGRLIDLTGATTLGESAALLQQASLVVGVDTGLTHVSLALQKPTVALFGATCPYLDTATPAGVVLYHQYPCSPCHRRPTCDGRFPCVKTIGVDEVMRAARDVLSRGVIGSS